MGNRAVIIAQNKDGTVSDIGLYVHWNGGFSSIQAFLAYCEMMKFRTPESDDYGWAHMAKIVGNFFDGGSRSAGLNVGIISVAKAKTESGTLAEDAVDRLSPGDNGVYVIRNWHIVEHFDAWDPDQPTSAAELADVMMEINEAQPYQVSDGEIAAFAEKYEEEEKYVYVA